MANGKSEIVHVKLTSEMARELNEISDVCFAIPSEDYEKLLEKLKAKKEEIEKAIIEVVLNDEYLANHLMG